MTTVQTITPDNTRRHYREGRIRVVEINDDTNFWGQGNSGFRIDSGSYRNGPYREFSPVPNANFDLYPMPNAQYVAVTPEGQVLGWGGTGKYAFCNSTCYPRLTNVFSRLR